MAKINLSEINHFIQNFFGSINLPQLEAVHAARLKKWLVENLSNIGRYSVRDFERTGNLKSLGKPYNDNRPHHFDRSDGWVSLTEEVHDLDSITYGTGALWIHGEMELPLYWPEQSKDNYGEAGDHIYNDEFHQVNYSGSQKHLYQRVTGEEYEFWYVPDSRDLAPETDDNGEEPANWGDPATDSWRFGYLWKPHPVTKPQILNGTYKPPNGVPAAYSDVVAWYYDTVTQTLGGDQVGEHQGDDPDGENDDLIYHLGNERNNYPWRIVSGSTPKAVKHVLEKIMPKKSNGMYDDTVPEMATEIGTWPPVTGIKYVKGKEKAILDFISPVDEVPKTGKGQDQGDDSWKEGFFKQTGINVDDPSTWPEGVDLSNFKVNNSEYAKAYFYNFGIDVNDPSTYPPNQVPPEDRAARGFPVVGEELYNPGGGFSSPGGGG